MTGVDRDLIERQCIAEANGTDVDQTKRGRDRCATGADRILSDSLSLDRGGCVDGDDLGDGAHRLALLAGVKLTKWRLPRASSANRAVPSGDLVTMMRTAAASPTALPGVWRLTARCRSTQGRRSRSCRLGAGPQ